MYCSYGFNPKMALKFAKNRWQDRTYTKPKIFEVARAVDVKERRYINGCLPFYTSDIKLYPTIKSTMSPNITIIDMHIFLRNASSFHSFKLIMKKSIDLKLSHMKRNFKVTNNFVILMLFQCRFNNKLGCRTRYAHSFLQSQVTNKKFCVKNKNYCRFFLVLKYNLIMVELFIFDLEQSQTIS